MVEISKEILITGSNGLVGSAICQLFYHSKIPFTAISRNKPPKTNLWKTIVADIEKNDFEEIFNNGNVQTIIHCAAVIPGKYSNFEDCFNANTAIDRKIADLAITRKVVEIIFISTTNLYGAIDEIITEETQPNIENLYAQAKINSENLFLSLGTIRCSCLRINAPYNPNQKNETVLSLFIRQALRDEDIKYHGTGSRQQDFTHTDDIAKAVLKCFQRKRQGIYNIASGQPIAMKNLAEMIVSLLPKSKSQVLPSGLPDLQEKHRAFFDLRKAWNDLDWRAEISLKQGISDWVNNF